MLDYYLIWIIFLNYQSSEEFSLWEKQIAQFNELFDSLNSIYSTLLKVPLEITLEQS